MTSLELTTGMDVDVAGIDLEVGVDGEQLVLPIRGKVVTPSAYVAPEEIDLGTACIGTSVRQNVLLTNNGTATLRVLRPVMDASNAFRPLFLDPSTYPDEGAQLPAGEIAMVAVEPAMSSAGTLTGVLTWDVVDLPAAPFESIPEPRCHPRCSHSERSRSTPRAAGRPSRCRTAAWTRSSSS
jgi:hypothetical protein